MESTFFLPKNVTPLFTPHQDPKWWAGLSNSSNFDSTENIAWMEKNWMISVYASIAYVTLIFGLQKWMKDRKAFNLKVPLILWNLSLAIFSIKGTFVVAATMANIFAHGGIHTTICDTFNHVDPVGGYWITLFIFSKIIELGDTLFLVLRKRPLIFLHWYHHITVLLYCWISFKNMESTGTWAAMINYMVHAFMYSYFTITAIGWKVPKSIAMSITAVQILQMVVNLWINLYAVQAKWTGQECDGISRFHLFLAFGLFGSYAFLFGNFFVKSYISGHRKKTE